MNKISRLVRSQHKHQTTTELLGQPTIALLGVSPAAADVLGEIGIHTVFDLASSRLFDGAAIVSDTSVTSSAASLPYARVPAGIAHDDEWNLSAAQLAASSLSALRALDPDLSSRMEQALDVKTVRDLACWPPYQAARMILSDAYGAMDPQVGDANAPADLVPVARQYAVESFKYSKIFIDQLEQVSTGDLRALSSDIQLDIVSLDVDAGFKAPATGALLTFVQEWVPQGLSLGQLLSSVALAPGESTKIAVIDWTRRVRTAASESIGEAEAVDAVISQKRAISEIQSGVAKEVNSGTSTQTTSSTTDAGGDAYGGGLGGLLGGGSGNRSFADVSGTSVSVASSAGERNVSAEMTQHISDSTKQQSSAVRTRRASVVTETEQSESETLRTRILTNYNHSHALSVHYYEVVQIFRTRVRLHDYKQVLFVPMKPVDFSDPRVIERFKQILVASVGSRYVRDQIIAFTSKVVVSELNSQSRGGRLYEFDEELEITHLATGLISGVRRETAVQFTMKGGRTIEIPLEQRRGFQKFERAVPLMDIEQIRIVHGTYSGDLISILRSAFLLKRPGVTKAVGILDFQTTLVPTLEATPCAQTRVSELDESVIDFLNDQALYFSQRIWASLSQQQLAMLLSRYAFRDEAIVEVVDLTPLTVFGNYLVLPYHPRRQADERWKDWQKKHIDTQRVVEDFVPVPTDGLFAEAVLGRSNASEKLDITRFWDWQDSPIPMQAPDIAPLQAGQHAVAGVPLPGQLGAPVSGLQTPNTLPAPIGLGPLFATLQSDLFRDLSGLEQAAANLQASVDAGSAAAENAAKLATELEAIKARTVGKLAEMAVGAGLAAATGGASLAAGGVTGAAGGVSTGYPRAMTGGPLAGAKNSTVGAALNYGRTRMEEEAGNRASQGGAGGVAGGRSGGPGVALPGASGSSSAVSPRFTHGDETAWESWVGHSAGPATATPDRNAAPDPSGTPESTDAPYSLLSLEEREDSMAAPFLIERIAHGTFPNKMPRYAWLIYDFGIGNADPFVNNGDKGPLSVNEPLKTRLMELVEKNIWIDLNVFGYSDNSGPAETNLALRHARAIKGAEYFVPTMDDRRRAWIKDGSDSDGLPTFIDAPINVKLTSAAPLDYFLEDNDLPAGRAKNRSILIVEAEIHNVKPPQGTFLMPADERQRLASISARIDELRGSQTKADRFKVLAFDLWMDPAGDLRVITQDGASTAILEHTYNSTNYAWLLATDAPSKPVSNYITDYRRKITAAMRSTANNEDNILTLLESVFLELFGGIRLMGRDLDNAAGISNNSSYISLRLNDWLTSQQRAPKTVYAAALEFEQ